MKLKTFFARTAVLAATVLGAHSAHATHDNDVFFAITGVKSFSFETKDYSISPGKKYKGTTSKVDLKKSQGVITVDADRHKTDVVANWFKTEVGGGETAVCDSKGNMPKELNFAVKGTLKFTKGDKEYTCEDFIVGQGSFGFNNNWWIGGPNMSGAHVSISGMIMQTCKVSGGGLIPVAKVSFAPQTPCVNHFSIGILVD